MKEVNVNEVKIIYSAKLSLKQFEVLSKFIYDELGIKLPPAKQTMLESRLQRRLREVNMSTFDEYIDYLFSKEGKYNELIHMLDVVTTNKTDFFREPLHFDFLRDIAIPEFTKNYPNRQLQLWSAGCSSGEEPYTLAMVLQDIVATGKLMDYNIYATDISTKILQKALMAIYLENRTNDVPLSIKKKYFLKSKDPLNSTVRIIPQLRSKIKFDRLNFMDDFYNTPTNYYDIIFCRNVIIYFDRQTQERVIKRLCNKLKTGGYFFLGHSESITNMDLPLVTVKPTIFKKI